MGQKNCIDKWANAYGKWKYQHKLQLGLGPGPAGADVRAAGTCPTFNSAGGRGATVSALIY